jgi:hypothetical protein
LRQRKAYLANIEIATVESRKTSLMNGVSVILLGAALSILLVGFLLGYGVRAAISLHRREIAFRRSRP